MPDGAAAQMLGRLQVDGHRAVPVGGPLLGGCVGRHLQRDARIVDEHVEASEGGECIVEEVLTGGGVGEVGAKGPGAVPEGSGKRLRRLAVAVVVDGDGRARARQPDGERASDAPARARDEDVPAGQIDVHGKETKGTRLRNAGGNARLEKRIRAFGRGCKRDGPPVMAGGETGGWKGGDRFGLRGTRWGDYSSVRHGLWHASRAQ